MIVKEGGTSRTITSGEVRIGGAVRQVTRGIARNGGTDVTIVTFTSPLTASASPVSVSGSRVGSGTATTNATQVTPEGGSGPFTYSWSALNGALGFPLSPSSANTQFIRVLNAGDVVTEQFRCTVTDSLGATAPTDVTAQFAAADIDLDDIR